MPLQPTAKFNQLFLCAACSRAFKDRAATQPIEVGGEDYVEEVRVPNAKYPSDIDLSIVVEAPRGGHNRMLILGNAPLPVKTLVGSVDPIGPFSIEASPAGECCVGHTVLVDSRTLKFRKDLDGTVHLVGAKHLE